MVVGLSTGRHGPWLKGTEATQQKKKTKNTEECQLGIDRASCFSKGTRNPDFYEELCGD